MNDHFAIIFQKKKKKQKKIIGNRIQLEILMDSLKTIDLQYFNIWYYTPIVDYLVLYKNYTDNSLVLYKNYTNDTLVYIF